MRIERRLHARNADVHYRADVDGEPGLQGQSAHADVVGVKGRRGAGPARTDFDRHINRMADELPHGAPPGAGTLQ
jgi:hypothetical protein